MRAKASSVTIPDISHWQISDTSNAYLPNAFELTPNVNGVLSTGMQFTHASGATAYRNYFLERRGTTAGKVIINAEL